MPLTGLLRFLAVWEWAWMRDLSEGEVAGRSLSVPWEVREADLLRSGGLWGCLG